MFKFVVKSAIFALLLPILLAGSPSSAFDNWPQWRGAGLDSVSAETGLPAKLDATSQVWRTPLPGPGGSSPIVWEDQIFVTSAEGDDLVLLCIGTDGKTRWKKKLQGLNVNIRMDQANSASPSPVTDGKHVWAMMTDGVVYCFTMDGEEVWHKNMQAYYGEFQIQFGMTSTPLLHDGRLYFQFIHGAMRDRQSTSTGWIVALESTTGNEIWKYKRQTNALAENKHAYTSPILYSAGDRYFLVTHGGDFAIGHSLEDGSEIWRCGGFNPKEGYNMFLRFVSSPVFRDNLIVLPSAKRGPVVALNVKSEAMQGDITQTETVQRWRIDRGTPDVSTPVIYGEHVYLAGERGDLSCLDVNTGEQLYRERLFADRHRSTPVAADNKLYIAGRDGTLFVVKSGPQMEVLSENALGEETTASPAVANGKIYIRTWNALYAFGSDLQP